MADTADTPLIVYRLVGGTPPPDDEQLTVAHDGAFVLWRTRATASRPPTAVGRFAGMLQPALLAQLRGAVDRCRTWASEHAAVTPAPFTPGASVETYVIDDERHQAAGDDPMTGAWADIAVLVRSLLVTLTGSPVAALALEQRNGHWHLVRLGDEELRMDLSRARFRVVRWDGDAPVPVQEGAVAGPRDERTRAGWVHEPGIDVPSDQSCTVAVDDVLLHDGSFWRAAGVYVRTADPGPGPN